MDNNASSTPLTELQSELSSSKPTFARYGAHRQTKAALLGKSVTNTDKMKIIQDKFAKQYYTLRVSVLKALISPHSVARVYHYDSFQPVGKPMVAVTATDTKNVSKKFPCVETKTQKKKELSRESSSNLSAASKSTEEYEECFWGVIGIDKLYECAFNPRDFCTIELDVFIPIAYNLDGSKAEPEDVFSVRSKFNLTEFFVGSIESEYKLMREKIRLLQEGDPIPAISAFSWTMASGSSINFSNIKTDFPDLAIDTSVNSAPPSEIGQLFIRVDLFNSSHVEKQQRKNIIAPEIIHEKITDVFCGSFAEEVANHIVKQYEDISIRLEKGASEKLYEIVKTPKIEPKAFDTITELLVRKSQNPVKEACAAMHTCKKRIREIKMASDLSDLILLNQWQEELQLCENRVLQLLDAITEIPLDQCESSVGEFLEDIPEQILLTNSAKIASHPVNFGILSQRWHRSKPNECCGLSCCCPVDEENDTVTRKWFFVNTPKAAFFWNLLSYIILVLFLTYYLVKYNGIPFRVSTAVRSNYLSPDADHDFMAISSAEGFWDWTINTLSDTIVSTSDTSTIVGVPAIRQWRISPVSCPGYPNQLCYLDMDADYNIAQTGGKYLNSSWDPVYGQPIYSGTYLYVIPSGGYIEYLPTTAVNLRQKFVELQNLDWIDNATRAVILEFVLYDTPSDTYTVVWCVLELSALKLVYPTSFIFVGLGRDIRASEYGIHILIAIFALGFLVAEFVELYEDWRKGGFFSYFVDPWNFCDIICYLALFILAVLKCVPLTSLDYEVATAEEVWFVYRLHFAINVFISVITAFLYMRFTYFMRVHKQTGPLAVIAFKLIKDVFYFLLLSTIVVASFSVLMFTFLRTSEMDFSTLQSSFYSLLGTSFSFSFIPGLGSFETFVANFLIWVFGMLAIVLLINLLIAKMGKTIDAVYEEANGTWVRQFTHLVTEFEGLNWPPPFNIFSLVIAIIQRGLPQHLLAPYKKNPTYEVVNPNNSTTNIFGTANNRDTPPDDDDDSHRVPKMQTKSIRALIRVYLNKKDIVVFDEMDDIAENEDNLRSQTGFGEVIVESGKKQSKKKKQKNTVLEDDYQQL